MLIDQKIKYPSLNGLRALSILLVVVHHLTIIEHVYGNLYEYTWLCPLLEFLQDGHLGVNVFFVISGFLITSLMLREEKQTKTVSLKNFYIRRTLRIFPAYYFLLLVYFILHLAGYIHISGPSWLTAVTYTKYFNWSTDWYLSHAWSLSIEEHFYILWPLVFILGIKARKILAFALVLIVPMVRIYVNFYPVDWINEMTIFTRIDSIATGCLFAMYQDEIIKKISRHWRLIFCFSALLLFFLRYVAQAADKIHLAFIFITYGSIANLLIALIMMFSVFGPHGIWFKFLNLKLLNYIGLLSYSIYLWQQVFISGTGHWVTKFPQNVVFILTAALFSFYVIESPFLRLKSKFQAKNSSRADNE